MKHDENVNDMNEWKLSYDRWIPESQPLREALCTLGNGFFCTRGAAEETREGGPHYPGTYLAGGYDRLVSEVAGRAIENEDLVNWPNWLCLNFRCEDGPWFRLEEAEILEFRQELDLRQGILERRVRFLDTEKRETDWISRRLVSMEDPHVCGIQWIFTPVNWSGKITFHSALDASVRNDGVARYRALRGDHLEFLKAEPEGSGAFCLSVCSRQSHVVMVQAALTRLFLGDTQWEGRGRFSLQGAYAAQDFELECKKAQPITLEKSVALYTSRDWGISEPTQAAKKKLERMPRFERLFSEHVRAWERIWKHCDIRLSDHPAAQRTLRLHVFHLLQSASPHTQDLDVGIPARGWHGEAYRGHIFWDELFIFPYLNLRLPEITRGLLKYRFRRLNEARSAARAAGYCGAMFPWQSGSDGREESQSYHLNPRSGRWIPDPTHLQRHVNAAIAYNVFHYYQTTHDLEFLTFYGAEMILEIARFWSSLVTFDASIGRYEIRGVMGPDEYHTTYPGAREPGLNNNAYTNIMAAWVLKTALRLFSILGPEKSAELKERLDISEEELLRWEDIAQKMKLVFMENGLLAQFEGYGALPEFPWEEYRKKYGDIQRLDRILEAEGKSPNAFKAGKQADVQMLFFLFSSEELTDLIRGMGYEFDPQDIPKTIDYYQQRISHGSTLSRMVESWVLARSDRPASWRIFQEALKSDVEDIQGGTTHEGIHLGAMAGTVDLLQRAYTGLELREDILRLNPCLPMDLTEMNFRIRYRGRWVELVFSQTEIRVRFLSGTGEKAPICVQDRLHWFEPGDEKIFKV
ncbi:MAG TPA: trehalose 6-phosphate phosphorylase [Deltaproteobacteria bacterium]|nr:trehalose 6-phosphate phosphorylase [Deltaproteobacteria bacterium]